MGNLLVCFRSKEESPVEDEYDAFQNRVYQDDPSSEEKIERRGSVFPPSPSVYRSSLHPGSIIPPYVEGSPSSSRSSISSSRRGTKVLPSEQQKKAKEVRILLLGSGESGKSTIIKQMKIIHQNGYSREEMVSFRSSIYRNIREGVEQVIRAAQKLQLSLILEACEEQINLILATEIDYENDTALPKEFVDAVNYIWLEGGIKPIFDQLSHSSYIYESVPLYHLSSIHVY